MVYISKKWKDYPSVQGTFEDSREVAILVELKLPGMDHSAGRQRIPPKDDFISVLPQALAQARFAFAARIATSFVISIIAIGRYWIHIETEKDQYQNGALPATTNEGEMSKVEQAYLKRVVAQVMDNEFEIRDMLNETAEQSTSSRNEYRTQDDSRIFFDDELCKIWDITCQKAGVPTKDVGWLTEINDIMQSPTIIDELEEQGTPDEDQATYSEGES